MSHYGNNFALSYRDKIVGNAVKTDKASINYQEGNKFSAALNDFKGNLLFGAVPQTLLGLGIIIPYSLAIGAGIKCGVDFYNYNKLNGWMILKYRIQKKSLIDLGLVYLLVIPLFFIASCFEFLSSWNI